MTTNEPIHPQVRIGHVHLKVADLQRALDFYVGVLGFELIATKTTSSRLVELGSTLRE